MILILESFGCRHIRASCSLRSQVSGWWVVRAWVRVCVSHEWVYEWVIRWSWLVINLAPTYLHTHTRTHTHMHTPKRIIHTHTFSHTLTHTNTHARTHAHIHTRTHLLSHTLKWMRASGWQPSSSHFFMSADTDIWDTHTLTNSHTHAHTQMHLDLRMTAIQHVPRRCEWVVCMSHVTHMHESPFLSILIGNLINTFYFLLKFFNAANESFERVMLHICMSHITQTYESCHA